MQSGRQGWRIVSESGTHFATIYADQYSEVEAETQAEFYASQYSCKVELQPIILKRDNRY